MDVKDEEIYNKINKLLSPIGCGYDRIKIKDRKEIYLETSMRSLWEDKDIYIDAIKRVRGLL